LNMEWIRRLSAVRVLGIAVKIQHLCFHFECTVNTLILYAVKKRELRNMILFFFAAVLWTQSTSAHLNSSCIFLQARVRNCCTYGWMSGSVTARVA
jgi:hypothetical protein